jgi:hypothetical protein
VAIKVKVAKRLFMSICSPVLVNFDSEYLVSPPIVHTILAASQPLSNDKEILNKVFLSDPE